MLFLAIVCGFMAESFREKITNKENERHYIENLLIDLQKDTTEIAFTNKFQRYVYDNLDKLSQIPMDRLKNFNTQDTFHHYFLIPYSFLHYFEQRNNTITQLKAGGFNLITGKGVIDSITNLYSYYEMIRHNNQYLDVNYRDLLHIGQQTMKLEKIYPFIDDPSLNEFLQNTEVFIKYDKPLLQQLYNVIGYSKASIINYIGFTEELKGITERLILFLKNKYHIE